MKAIFLLLFFISGLLITKDIAFQPILPTNKLNNQAVKTTLTKNIKLSNQSLNKKENLIFDARSLGKFLFSVNDSGVLYLFNDPEMIQSLQNLYLREKQIKPIEAGIFRSPDFDWKEDPNELLIHFFVMQDETAAQRIQNKVEDRIFCRNGKFLLFIWPMRETAYRDGLLKLSHDSKGNLLAPPLEIIEKKIGNLSPEKNGKNDIYIFYEKQK